MSRVAFVLCIGLLAGAALWLDVLAARGAVLRALSLQEFVVGLSATSAAFAASLLLLRFAVWRLVRRLAPAALGPGSAYLRYEHHSYAAFLLLAAGAAGIGLSVPLAYVVVLAFASVQIVVVLRALERHDHASAVPFFDSTAWLALLFLISGMAALVYEVVWQRVLYATYGVNIESVTLIVAVFMLGLGAGALAGGAVSKRFPTRVPELFAACECVIGIFGLFSIPLIEAVGARTLQFSMLGVACVVFALLLVPTLCMGATLPMLVAHVTRYDAGVGASMGRLYAMNTLGAAVASLLTVDVLFVLVGRQTAVLFAALLNLTVAVFVYRYAARLRRSHEPAAPNDRSNATPATTLRAGVVLAMAAVCGFVSLSQEILWVRVIAFAMGSAPQVFGHVLGLFLIGLALGAWRAKRLCEARVENPVLEIGRRFLAASALYFVSIPAAAFATTLDKGVGLAVAYLAVALLAYLLGVVLPLLTHIGVSTDAEVGPQVARIYLFNVLGATAGPLITAFVALDRFSLEECVLAATLVFIVCALALLVLSGRSAKSIRSTGVAIVLLVAAPVMYRQMYAGLFDKLLAHSSYGRGVRFTRVVQNRSGVIAVLPDRRGDIVYGGGAQDGRFNLDPVTDANMIRRAYAVAALHPDPKQVLEIGLASGSWARVLASYQAVERLTIVEINPGYAEVIAAYPDHRSVLTHPKVSIHYDDGRRWLRRNPDRRFDLIVMNTTYHWRSNVTNLVSKEFLELAKGHLLPRGVLYYNTTDSPDIVYTAATVFAHVTMYRNFVAASDHPFDLTAAEKRAALQRFERDGSPLLDPSLPRMQQVLEDLSRAASIDVGESYRARSLLVSITDDNMLTEFKRIHSKDAIGKLYRFYRPEAAWVHLWH